jgi:hypothetical protein
MTHSVKYERDSRGSTPMMCRAFCLTTATGPSLAHPAFWIQRNVSYFPSLGMKRPGRESGHLHTAS